jgi:hypothetical protein
MGLRVAAGAGISKIIGGGRAVTKIQRKKRWSGRARHRVKRS